VFVVHVDAGAAPNILLSSDDAAAVVEAALPDAAAVPPASADVAAVPSADDEAAVLSVDPELAGQPEPRAEGLTTTRASTDSSAAARLTFDCQQLQSNCTLPAMTTAEAAPLAPVPAEVDALQMTPVQGQLIAGGALPVVVSVAAPVEVAVATLEVGALVASMPVAAGTDAEPKGAVSDSWTEGQGAAGSSTCHAADSTGVVSDGAGCSEVHEAIEVPAAIHQLDSITTSPPVAARDAAPCSQGQMASGARAAAQAGAQAGASDACKECGSTGAAVQGSTPDAAAAASRVCRRSSHHGHHLHRKFYPTTDTAAPAMTTATGTTSYRRSAPQPSASQP